MEPRVEPCDREGMHRVRVFTLLLVLGFLAATPAAALHARYLDIVVDRNGDATVTFEYNLSFVEGFLSLLGAINPSRDIERIFAASTGQNTTTLSTADGSTTFGVRGFATVVENDPSLTFATVPVNLSWGQAGYESSVIAPLLDPDFSPDSTVIRFPDAWSVTFHDLFLVPTVNHSF